LSSYQRFSITLFRGRVAYGKAMLSSSAEEKEMRYSGRLPVAIPAVVVVAFAGPWLRLAMGQETGTGGQTAADVSGAGVAGRIPVWRNSTTLGDSLLTQSGANVGIGTTAPAAPLEVNGDALVDGDLTLSGSILLTGAGTLIWAPEDGSGNFSAGLDALQPTTTRTGNTAVGDSALHANTSGYFNTANGFQALRSNTIGYNNTAVGVEALQDNTNGDGNTAIGFIALGQNVAGQGNTATGQEASNRSTADGNTATGFYALANNTTGNYNIAIGYKAGVLIRDTSNNIDINNAGTAVDSGAVRIGTTGTQTSAYIAGISNVNVSGATVVVGSSGQLGVALSSRRYKENIQDMGSASDGLMRLRPVTFQYKKAFSDGSQPVQYGLIAEEVAPVYPDLVARSADGQIESVRYQVLDSMLLNELQKQNATIAAQKEQIRALEERLTRVEAAMSGATRTALSR
jgi:hypothetical protein